MRWPIVGSLATILLFASCVSGRVGIGPTDAPASQLSRTVTPGKGYGLTGADDGQTVSLPSDTDLIRVVLEDEYEWQLRVEPNFLRLEQSGPVAAQGFRAQLWLFRLLRDGDGDKRGRSAPTSFSGADSCRP